MTVTSALMLVKVTAELLRKNKKRWGWSMLRPYSSLRRLQPQIFRKISSSYQIQCKCNYSPNMIIVNRLNSFLYFCDPTSKVVYPETENWIMCLSRSRYSFFSWLRRTTSSRTQMKRIHFLGFPCLDDWACINLITLMYTKEGKGGNILNHQTYVPIVSKLPTEKCEICSHVHVDWWYFFF